jgi:hypothetical protein
VYRSKRSLAASEQCAGRSTLFFVISTNIQLEAAGTASAAKKHR